MKLTVLGNTGPYPRSGGACSGYLIEHNDSKIILDMGNGTLANFRTICDIEKITAIICSHLHADHISDLFVLRYALEMRGMTLPLYAPSGSKQEFERLVYKNAYEITPITEALSFDIDGLHFTFMEMKHPSQDFAIKITDGNSVFMYTGDTAYCQSLVEFAKDVDMLLCDCAFLEDIESDVHLSMNKAIEVANTAGVRRLIMTHFNPEISPQRYFEIGNGRFKGRLSKAEMMSNFIL
ncbi:MAG: MBL fold metallo-hydrolase [Eubacterium sp.]